MEPSTSNYVDKLLAKEKISAADAVQFAQHTDDVTLQTVSDYLIEKIENDEEC